MGICCLWEGEAGGHPKGMWGGHGGHSALGVALGWALRLLGSGLDSMQPLDRSLSCIHL